MLEAREGGFLNRSHAAHRMVTLTFRDRCFISETTISQDDYGLYERCFQSKGGKAAT